jgi:MoaA/NifB/PqqE/SkfB family radical SAM enzyme
MTYALENSGKKRNFIIAQIIDTTRRYKWKIVPYDRDLLFTLVITDKCTLRCEHCFEEAGPENNTFLDASRVDKLAEESIDIFRQYQNPGYIRITGGDPFLHRELCQIIESFSKRRDLLGYDTIDVETNGWWATDDETTETYVKMLKETGATLLSMTIDYFHCKQGKFNVYEHFRRIGKIAEEQRLRFRNIPTGVLISDDEEIKKEEEKHRTCCLLLPEVTPIGRARLLPEKYWGNYELSNHLSCIEDGCKLTPPIFTKVKSRYTHTDRITVKADGNVYPCDSGKEFEHVSLSLGNIYEQSLSEIIKNQNNPVVQLIRERGLRGLSKLVGVSLRKHWKMYYRFTPCGMCHEILREHGERLANKLYNN